MSEPFDYATAMAQMGRQLYAAASGQVYQAQQGANRWQPLPEGQYQTLSGPQVQPSPKPETVDSVLDEHLSMLRTEARAWARKCDALKAELEGHEAQLKMATDRLTSFELELAKRAAGK